MKIAIVHVPYEFSGGEEAHVKMIRELYLELGHQVELFSPGNYSKGKPSLRQAFNSLTSSEFLPESWGEDFLSKVATADIVHAHNIYPLMGPRFLEWCIVTRKRILWTIHNHRFFCTNGLALREGKICELCFDDVWKWRPIVHNCNGSVAKSAYYSLALSKIQQRGLWHKLNAIFIAPSSYIEGKLLKFGLPEQKVKLVPNPVSSQFVKASADRSLISDVLYCGRLSPEKGVSVLLEAIEKAPDVSFTVAGDGPCRREMEALANQCSNLRYLGKVEGSFVKSLLANTQLAILPSVCNEILPTFLIEAMVGGVNCMASDLESLKWLSAPPFGVTLFEAGSAAELVKAIRGQLKEGKNIQMQDLDKVREYFSMEAYKRKIGELLT